jgi:pseudouridine synthase
MLERLQKVMARAGVASRRHCEDLIVSGRVRVNDRVVRELGTKVDPSRDRIEVDGQRLRLPARPRFTYVMLHKPRGYVSDEGEPTGKPTARSLVDIPGRLFAVGRLDMRSEGLLLLTNDGALTHRLTHPRYGHEKEYRVLVTGRPGPRAIAALRKGVRIQGIAMRAAQVWVERVEKGNTWLRFVLRQGRKRQIRHMAAAVGHPALRIIRVRLGPLHLGDLRPGQWRFLTRQEVRDLRQAVR